MMIPFFGACQSVRKTFEEDVRTHIPRVNQTPGILQPEDLQALPMPVRRHLENCGFAGREKVMTAGRGARPAFAWSDRPLYAATDVYFIVRRAASSAGVGVSLLALTGILNSAVAAFWFAHRTKTKKDQHEYFSTVLERFPLPPLDGTTWEGTEIRRLERCVHRLQRAQLLLATAITTAEQHRLQQRLRRWQQVVDAAVYRLYRLPAAAAAHIRAATGGVT